MEKIRRTDGTVLTEEEIEKIRKEVENSGSPIGKYTKISELEGTFFPVVSGYVEIVKVTRTDTELIFQLRTGNFLFEKEAVYPLSKELDKKDKILSDRFMSFLEWYVFKNIDKIFENNI